MGDDAELYIESGGDLTTLIPDYCWDDYDDSIYSDSPSRKKNTMVFIDAENMSVEHCPGIIGQSKSIGEVYEIRYYARQNDPSTAAWKDCAKTYGIKPILMCGEASNNKIDNKIIKDIRKIISTNKSIDIFCIASCDGDFTGITQELRGLKKRVVILASKNTSGRLKKSASEVRGV